jgi:hypothetical protein
MTSIFNGYPTEKELRRRISNQLSWRNTTEVALLWHGYLNALLEWGLIDVNIYHSLQEVLPRIGMKESYEQALDEQLDPEQEKEFDKKMEAGVSLS